MTKMPSTDLFSELSFSRGPDMKNRFMLAPLTNLQSHVDGRLSEDEYKCLTMRRRGDEEFQMAETPVSRDYLRAEGLGDAFIEYMSSWAGFVEEA